MFPDPGNGIDAGAGHPGDVTLPVDHGGRIEDEIERDFAAGEPCEFEVVIVPAEAQALAADPLADAGQALAEAAIACGAARAVLRIEPGRKDLANAEGPGDVEHGGALVLEQVKAEMAGGHGKPVPVEQAAQRGRIVIDAAIALHLAVANRRQQGQRVLERRDIAGAVELEGEAAWHGCGFRSGFAAF